MILREYQQKLVDDAVFAMGRHGIVYLALDTRVGKTPVSIMTAREICRERGIDSILFATKKSVIPSINKTLAELRIDYEIPQDVQVVSFDSLHKVAYARRVIIVDEAHSFGAFPKPAKRARMLRQISRNCPIIYLSASPTPESYSQIYHQLWAGNCGVFDHSTFYKWANDYVNVTQKYVATGTIVKDYSDAKWELLKPILDEITITFTQEQAGFNHIHVREVFYKQNMPPEIWHGIKHLKKDRIIRIGDYTVTADTGASLMSKVHQLCSGTVIPDGYDDGIIVSRHKIASIDFVLKLYDKVAVYYKFRAEREMLIEKYGDRIIEDWTKFAGSDKIFISQVLSGREGIDLKEADCLIIMTPDHAYTSYIQTINRLQNIHRTAPPVIVWLFSIFGDKHGIEESIYNCVRGKRNYTESYFKRYIKGV